MTQELLNLLVFEKAIETLGDALNEYQKDTSNSYVRDSCIQRFEYCYDLSTKIIRRFLSNISEIAEDIQNKHFSDIIRLAYTRGILKNSWDMWKEYRDNRNATSHGYDEKRAIDIVEKIPLFYTEVIFLLERLKVINET
jgi:nucleotidyltransferase substrate binding protein (TIGR01987 family)